MQPKNIIGHIYGRLTVLSFEGYKSYGKERKAVWLCKCACGRNTVVTGNSLSRGDVKSCGCLKKEKLPVIGIRHGLARRNNKHPVYRAWKSMNWRCSPRNKKMRRTYFGRGITVCERWKDPVNFAADMMDGYYKGATLHRKNNDAGYFKENCKWASNYEQCREKTNSRKISLFGLRKNLCDWVE